MRNANLVTRTLKPALQGETPAHRTIATNMFTWNPFALPWVIVALMLVALAGVIYARQRASRVGVLFCGMIAFVAVWFGAFAAMFSTHDPGVAAFAARIGLAAVCFLPAAVYDFTATALRLRSTRQRLVRAGWTVSAAFAGVTLLPRGMVGGVELHPWGFYPTAGPAMVPFILYFAATLLFQFVEGVTEWRRTSDPGRRRRVAKLMLSFLVVYVATIDWLPMFGYATRPVAFVPVIAFMLVAWGTIRRHRFRPITAARASREILDTMADALFVIDEGGNIRVVNRSVTDLLGLTDADLVGRAIDEIEVAPGDAAISRTLAELSRHGAIRDQERLLRHAAGHSISVSVSISPVGTRDSREGAVIIARDIRDRKRAEDELKGVLTRLEQSNRELEDFAYVASHDLQEPLRKIRAFGDLLRSKHAEALPPQAQDYIERMQSAAKRMQGLISDLLSFSRVTTKAQPFSRVDIGRIASEVVKDLEGRLQETGGHVEVGPLPSIDADPLQMRQLLQNLAGNALKFHREGIPPLVTLRGEIADGQCHLIVSDNGIGFDDKYAERIFTMFERLHGRHHYEGTGIGLAICRKIVERHGGQIRAHGKPGEGAIFTVTLPARQMQAAVERTVEEISGR